MAAPWSAIKWIFLPVAPLVRGLPDRRRIIFGSFPNLCEAFSADDLPLPFILRRDSLRRKAGNGKRHKPLPRLMSGRISRESGVYLAPQRVYTRSALPANADRRGGHRAA